MSDIQTCENRACDSRVSAHFGIDWVREKWQNAANVPGLFAKTDVFPTKHLAATVKTNLAPPDCNRARPTTSALEVRHG